MKFKLKLIILVVFLVNLNICLSENSDSDTTLLVYTQILGFELEIASIGEIFKKLGPTKIYESGTAAYYSKRFSYFFDEEKCFVTFDVTEVGADSIIHQISIKKRNKDDEYKTLPNLSLNKLDLGGIRIGMNRSDFIERFGSKCKIKNDRIYVSSNSRIPKSNKRTRKDIPDEFSHCDQAISLSAKFESNKLIEFTAFKFTTF